MIVAGLFAAGGLVGQSLPGGLMASLNLRRRQFWVKYFLKSISHVLLKGEDGGMN